MELLTYLSFTLFLFLFLFIVQHWNSSFRRRMLPPGPKGLPVFGNLFQIGPKPHESLTKLAQKYGPLMTIRQGCVTTIIASSAEMAQLILQKHDAAFSGRILPDAMTTLEHHAHSVAWLSPNDQWRVIRRVLGMYLTNSNKLDSLCELRQKVMEELVQHVRKICKQNQEQALGIGKLAFTTALNQMSNTCFSCNVDDYESDDDKGFRSAVATVMELSMKFNVADYFPLLKPFDLQRLRPKAKAAYGCLEALCDNFISQRLEHRQHKLPTHGDLLDSFMDFNQENESEFTLKHIQVLLVELHLAASETSTNTTEWAMTELILHPEKMQKLRDEICESVKIKGIIKESEILKLPYLQAVVKETMRLHLAVPFLIPHKTEIDVKLNGYEIPKNTQVLVNAWAIARDENYWENPIEFMPERFLNTELNFRGQHFSFIPFGSGRRMCSGIDLAQRVVSLMIASLVYNFEWKLPGGMKAEELDMNQSFGLTLQRAVPLFAVPISLK